MPNHNLIEKGVALILKGLGCDLKDRNFTDTPERVARFYQEMFKGEDTDWAVFPEEHAGLILLRNHTLWTLCPHHLLPVELKVSLAYIPAGKVLGLSKLARLMNELNVRPLLQEDFTHKLPLLLMEYCKVLGAACYVQGKHDCTRIRGVRSSGDFITYSLVGEFEDNLALQERFFRLL